MDQIAALHWIQQNIALFGGDPSNVTLAGHGSGAACINFLMISPTVMPGLFHRTILLSGSALSSWALVSFCTIICIFYKISTGFSFIARCKHSVRNPHTRFLLVSEYY